MSWKQKFRLNNIIINFKNGWGIDLNHYGKKLFYLILLQLNDIHLHWTVTFKSLGAKQKQ